MEEPNGLLAVGGNLQPGTLLCAYSQGIFPWYEDDQPILWWSPDPRAVIEPGTLHISRSLAKCLRQSHWNVTLDTAFEKVIHACAALRDNHGDGGTWITDKMMAAYIELHRLGHAHSVEVWQRGELVGGLYGVAIGGVFCGESMFSWVANASKIALVELDKLAQQQQFELIDCQIPNPHLTSMGTQAIPRSEFLTRLSALRDKPCDWPKLWDYRTV